MQNVFGVSVGIESTHWHIANIQLYAVLPFVIVAMFWSCVSISLLVDTTVSWPSRKNFVPGASSVFS